MNFAVGQDVFVVVRLSKFLVRVKGGRFLCGGAVHVAYADPVTGTTHFAAPDCVFAAPDAAERRRTELERE